MTTRILRKIVKIDEEKCNGCGICVPSCAEGALRIIDGKARLVSEKYCDGLGACLGECPQDAITIVDAEAEEFDEEAAKRHMEHQQQTHTEEKLPCGCPSHSIHQFEKQDTNTCECEVSSRPSALGHFPVKLELVPPEAPFLKGADLLLAADCSAFCYGGFHRDFLKGHALLTACPKLHDFQARVDKLTEILTRSSVKSLKVLRMEVPCCSGLVHMAEKAIEQSGKKIPLEAVTIGIKGDIRD